MLSSAVIDEVCADREAADSRFNVIADATRRGVSSKQRESFYDIVDDSIRCLDAGVLSNLPPNFLEIGVGERREPIPGSSRCGFFVLRQTPSPTGFDCIRQGPS